MAALGFYPGLVSLMPLDPRCRLTAPKYDPPRTWTYKGTIGIGGSLCSIYPDRTPGGYQMIARTPGADLGPCSSGSPRSRKASRSSVPATACASSRRAPRNTMHVADRVEAGTYLHNVAEYQRFSIRNYHRWLATIDETVRF